MRAIGRRQGGWRQPGAREPQWVDCWRVQAKHIAGSAGERRCLARMQASRQAGRWARPKAASRAAGQLVRQPHRGLHLGQQQLGEVEVAKVVGADLQQRATPRRQHGVNNGFSKWGAGKQAGNDATFHLPCHNVRLQLKPSSVCPSGYQAIAPLHRHSCIDPQKLSLDCKCRRTARLQRTIPPASQSRPGCAPPGRHSKQTVQHIAPPASQSRPWCAPPGRPSRRHSG